MLPTRAFGSTGQRVSVLGMGGAFITQAGDAGVAAVHRAIELGVTYFDTSPGYCGGASQPTLGRALRGRREPFLLATKLGYLPRREDHRSEKALTAQLEDNLRLLGREAVDVLQVHEADLAHWWSDDPALTWRIPPDREFDFAEAPVMRVLRDAKRRGHCRWIGVTGNGAAEMTRVLRAVEVDTFLLAFNYDLLHREAQREALPLAGGRGVATILAGVLHCGHLAAVRPEWLESPPPWMAGEVERYRRLYALRGECGLSLQELTIRFVLGEPRAAMVLVGAATPAEVDEAVRAAGAGPLEEGLHRRVEALVEA